MTATMRAGSPKLRRIEAGLGNPRHRQEPVDRNRTDAAADLLGSIEGWSRGVQDYQSRMGRALFGHGGYVPLLRRRLTVTPETERLVRAFLDCFPEPKAAFSAESSGQIREWLHGRGIYR